MAAARAYLGGSSFTASLTSLVGLYALIYSIILDFEPLTAIAVQLLLVSLIVQVYTLVTASRMLAATPGYEDLSNVVIVMLLVSALTLGILYTPLIIALGEVIGRRSRMLSEAGVLLDPWLWIPWKLLLALWPVAGPLGALVAGERITGATGVAVVAAMRVGSQEHQV
ncbi:hypothetical protein Pyrfu_1367 [Pyrolobus fumarii 1A]|uniref:Uncharacterized protein n=1 Tax=Pyrolobus fumarii (strain DSM 11204 / 1A) TaxID=694429 RepID=G0EGS7_PYRF1|nr:hypothetical protein [Pyrolobus fumarii]AEM39225.1 hypothetical protein Pyrfu_1367 [Pyrolobus fumarii 1A]